jgi:hypothetical protein
MHASGTRGEIEYRISIGSMYVQSVGYVKRVIYVYPLIEQYILQSDTIYHENTQQNRPFRLRVLWVS